MSTYLDVLAHAHSLMLNYSKYLCKLHDIISHNLDYKLCARLFAVSLFMSRFLALSLFLFFTVFISLFFVCLFRCVVYSAKYLGLDYDVSGIWRWHGFAAPTSSSLHFKVMNSVHCVLLMFCFFCVGFSFLFLYLCVTFHSILAWSFWTLTIHAQKLNFIKNFLMKMIFMFGFLDACLVYVLFFL